MSNSKEDEEFRLMFKVYIEDLRFWKKQQWHILYLTLVGISAVTTLGLHLKCFSGRLFLIVCCLVIWIIGRKFLYEYNKSIIESRRKKGLILLKFAKGVREIDEIFGVRESGANKRDLGITRIFCFIGFMAWAIAAWALR